MNGLYQQAKEGKDFDDPRIPEQVKDLLNKMIEFDQDKRITAA